MTIKTGWLETSFGQSYNGRVEAADFIKNEKRRHQVSVKNAVEGIRIAFRTQPNFAYHTFFSLCAIFLGVFLGIGRTEWLVIMLLVVVGMVVEMANTAFESVVDLATNVWHKEAKVAKDVAAGMMLFFAYGSVLIAVIIFFPYMIIFLQKVYPPLATR